MKKILKPKFAPFLVIGGSLVGLLLRIWTQGGGRDAFGLYPRMPLAWVVFGIFSVALAAAMIIAVRPLEGVGSYEENFPRSIVGCISYLLAGGGVLYSAYEQFSGPMSGMTDGIAVYFGFGAGVVVLALSAFPLRGKRPPVILSGIVALYLAMRLFNRCQIWGSHAQFGASIVPFLASVALMPAFYQRIAFDADMGNRPKQLAWAFVTVYLCVVALLNGEDMAFYATWAVWLMTNLCSLKPLEKTVPAEDAPSAE